MRRLRAYLLEKGCFTTLAVGTLYAILRGAHLVVRQCRSWFGRFGQKQPVDAAEFDRRKADVLEAYAPLPKGEVTVCVDAKRVYHRPEGGTSWQHEDVPAHRPARYSKPGTRTDIIGALTLQRPALHLECTPSATGAVMGKFLAETVQRCLKAGAKLIHLVMDNSSVNTAALKETVAAALLTSVRVHWTPPHASWLNLAEPMWSSFHRAIIQNSCFYKHEAVIEVVERYQVYWNAHPHQYRWPKHKPERHRTSAQPEWKRLISIPFIS